MAIAIFGSKSKSRGLNALVCVPAVSDPAYAALFTSSLLLFTEPEDRNMVTYLITYVFLCMFEGPERKGSGRGLGSPRRASCCTPSEWRAADGYE